MDEDELPDSELTYTETLERDIDRATALAAHLQADLTECRAENKRLRAVYGPSEGGLGGLFNGCGRGVHLLADHLAEAWLVISQAEDGDGKSNRLFPDELPGYVSEDWSKMVARRIKGYARLHERPAYFPWQAREFDQFSWRTALDAAQAGTAGEGENEGG